jgi:hypothetical protein
VTGGVLQPHVRSLLESVPNAWIEKPIDIDGLRDLVRRRARYLTARAPAAIAG